MIVNNFRKNLEKYLSRNPLHSQLPMMIGNRTDLKNWDIVPVHIASFDPICFLNVSNINPANALWMNYALPKSKEELV